MDRDYDSWSKPVGIEAEIDYSKMEALDEWSVEDIVKGAIIRINDPLLEDNNVFEIVEVAGNGKLKLSSVLSQRAFHSVYKADNSQIKLLIASPDKKQIARAA